MNVELIIIFGWAVFSLITLIIAVIGIKRCKKVRLSLLLTYFIAQPLSWTIMFIGNGGGFIITPVPDLIAITERHFETVLKFLMFSWTTVRKIWAFTIKANTTLVRC